MRPRIVFVSQFTASAAIARDMVPAGYELVVVDANGADFFPALAQADYLVGFVASKINNALFEAAPRLKLIQLLSAGYDGADIAAAQGAGVPVANNGGANAIAVAEHALMLMLAVSRRLIWQHANVSSGRWRGTANLNIHELHGKTLGIIGLGTIGKKTAGLALAFGMSVLYYDIARLSDHAEAAHSVQFRLLPEILRQSDILSLHVPLNDTTHQLLDADALKLMKPSAIVINTSRGPVIDEHALHQALTSGRLAGAGLDVFAEEPPPPNHPLFDLANVVLTAHLAGPTEESHVARIRNAFDNVQRVARAEAPLWVIAELR